MIDTGVLQEVSVWGDFMIGCGILLLITIFIILPLFDNAPYLLVLCPVAVIILSLIFFPPRQSDTVFKFDNIDSNIWTIAAVPDLDDLLRDQPSLASTTCLLTSPNAADKRFECTFVRIDSNQQQTSIRPMDKGLFAPEKPRAVRYEVWGTEEWRAAQISKTSDTL